MCCQRYGALEILNPNERTFMKMNFIALSLLSLSLAQVSQAAGFTYDCAPMDVAGSTDFFSTPVAIEISGNHLTVTDPNQQISAVGTLNPAYHRQVGKSQFTGLDELAGGESMSVEAVVTNSMLTGAPTGKMTLSARGEMYDHGSYRCTRN
jgi:hypothetical protein